MVLPEQMLSVTEHIVDTKLADFDPAYLEDRYRTTLVSILREKKAIVPARAGPAVPSRKKKSSIYGRTQAQPGDGAAVDGRGKAETGPLAHGGDCL